MAAGMFKNRVTEKDVRNWLSKNGFYGGGADISDLELHAIKRPGWSQVFRFTVCVKPKTSVSESDLEEGDFEDADDDGSARVVRYGVVLDDQRGRTETQQTKISIFDSIEARDELLEERSAGMITCSAGQNGDMYVLTIVVVAFVVVSLVLGSLVGN